MPCLDPATLQTWLEWAGARLIAMPGPRTGPKEPKGFWPAEFSQDKFQVLEFRGGLPIRAGAPSAEEISWVDEILLLPNVCERDVVRRIIHTRLLIHPIRGTHLYTWTSIAKKLSIGPHKIRPYTIKKLHRDGLKEVCEKTDPARVCRIAPFMASRA